MDETAIAISTCDRHAMLRQLLETIAGQDAHRVCPILIADNGADPAEPVVAEFRDRLRISYRRVPEAGVSPSRNATLAMAREAGVAFLALIDDDELPSPGWVPGLVRTAHEAQADLVYGDVYPIYLAPPPKWVEAGEVFVKTNNRGSENTLLRMSSVPADPAEWFSPDFALSGGSDFEFVTRMVAQGAREARNGPAAVHEQIPASRMTFRYAFRRGMAYGMTAAKLGRSRTGLRLAGYAARWLACKSAFALNHCFWSALGRKAHFGPGVQDLGDISGFVLGLLGLSFRFYGRSPGAAPPPPSA